VSIDVIVLVLDAPIQPPARRLVAVVLAEAANADGSRAFPGRGRLQRRTGLEQRAIRAHIAALIESGVLREEKRAKPGVRRQFAFNLDRLRTYGGAHVPPNGGTAVPSTPAGGGAQGPERRHPAAAKAAAPDPPSVLSRPEPSEVRYLDEMLNGSTESTGAGWSHLPPDALDYLTNDQAHLVEQVAALARQQITRTQIVAIRNDRNRHGDYALTEALRRIVGHHRDSSGGVIRDSLALIRYETIEVARELGAQ
jgi:hypothetical protein